MDDCMSVSSGESRSDDCSDDNGLRSLLAGLMIDGDDESEHVVDDDKPWTWPRLDLEEALPRLRSNDGALTHLRLWRKGIDAEGARELAGALKGNNSLTHLALENNKIGAEGARALGEGLKENDTLAHLDLRENEIGAEGARALGEGLKENDALAHLYLGNNEIGAEGARALAEGLKENDALVHLGLGRNRIGAEGAQVIADGLKESKTTKLTSLNLVSNKIGHEGSDAEGYIGGLTSRNNLLQLHREGVQKEGFDFYFGKDNHGSSETDSMCVKETVWKAASTFDGLVLGLVQEVLNTYLDGCSGDALKSRSESLKKMFDHDRSPGGSPLLHLAAALDSEAALNLCQFLVEEIGVDFDKITDQAGRTARDVAQGSSKAETSKWAKSVGTFLGRYFIEEYGKYKSATCTVHFAVDVEKPKGDPHRNVAIKIMEQQEQFERELNTRLRDDLSRVGSGVDIETGMNYFAEDHVVPLLRYNETDFKGKSYLCLVMPKGERNLDEIIRYERIAGRDINAIILFAADIAEALKELNENEIIHRDFKPRNIVRIHGDYKLIDFDASVRIGMIINEGDSIKKLSTGYGLPPEIAKVSFRPRETLDNLKASIEALQKEINDAVAGGDYDSVGELSERRKKVNEKIKQMEIGEMESSRLEANASIDIWSYGVVMYQMLTGRSLFNCDLNDDLLNDQEKRKLVNWDGICEDDLKYVLADCQDEHLVEPAKELLRKCLSTEGSRLKSFKEVLELPFLNRENLLSQKMKEVENLAFIKILEGQQALKQGQKDIKQGQHALKQGHQDIKQGQDDLKQGQHDLEQGQDDLKQGQQDIKRSLDGLGAKFDEMKAQLEIALRTVSAILQDSDAPKLLLVVPEGSSWKDWNLNSLVGEKVKVIFICPVSLSVPRDKDNNLMGYTMTLARGWVEKYGPALKISVDVLKAAFAVARLATGLPLPNLNSVGKSTSILKVINDSVVGCMGKSRAPDLKELEKALEDKLTLTVSDESMNKAARETLETKEKIEASYKEVKMLAQANADPKFFKTGLVKVEKDGIPEYIIDDDTIKALYKKMGQAYARLTPKERIEHGANINAIAKEGWLRKKSKNKAKMPRWKEVYCVLRKNGLLTYYPTKNERDEDLLGLNGTTKPKKVKTFSFNGLNKSETDNGVFCVIFVDETSQKFGGIEIESLTPKESAGAWISRAQKSLYAPNV